MIEPIKLLFAVVLSAHSFATLVFLWEWKISKYSPGNAFSFSPLPALLCLDVVVLFLVFFYKIL
jgi:hypothetical protein